MLEQNETQSTEAIVALMQLLQTIDSDSAEAKLNETTMSDNNGGRINY